MIRFRVMCTVLLLWQGTAFAQTELSPEVRARASAHFERGVELFEDGAHRAALAEFRRAYEIAPNYRLLYNIGQTQLELQDFLGAAESYEAYLRDGGSEVPEEQRTALEDALASLRSRAARIVVNVNREGAEIFLDDVFVGRSPISSALPVNVGQHRVMARSANGVTGSKLVELTSGEIIELSIELADPPQVAAIAAPPERTMSLPTKLAITSLSLGGALLLGSLSTGVLALSADSDLETLLKHANVEPSEESDQRSRLKALALATDVMLATGAALLVTGTVMWLAGRREGRERAIDTKHSHLRVDVGLGIMSLRGQF